MILRVLFHILITASLLVWLPHCENTYEAPPGANDRHDEQKPSPSEKGMTDTEKVQADKAALAIGYQSGDSASSVTLNPTLPSAGSNGTTITWSSDTPGNFSNGGVVSRPAYNLSDVSVAVTATISSGSASDTLVFNITVKKHQGSQLGTGAVSDAAIYWWMDFTYVNSTGFTCHDNSGTTTIFTKFWNGSSWQNGGSFSGKKAVLANDGSTAYIALNDGSNNIDLHKFNFTTSSWDLVKDNMITSWSSDRHNLKVVGNKAYFGYSHKLAILDMGTGVVTTELMPDTGMSGNPKPLVMDPNNADKRWFLGQKYESGYYFHAYAYNSGSSNYDLIADKANTNVAFPNSYVVRGEYLNSTLYAWIMSNTDNKVYVYQYSGSGQAWTKISNAFALYNVWAYQLLTLNGKVYLVTYTSGNSTIDLYEYAGSGTTWNKVSEVAISGVKPSGNLGASTDGQSIYVAAKYDDGKVYAVKF